jgi:electron transfer flavoprotein alpha subunit
METIGLLIEFADGRVKPANYGIATAAFGKDRQVVALVVDAPAGQAKTDLEKYGVSRILNITSGAGDQKWHPALQAEAVVSAMEHFKIQHLIGLSSPAGRELLPRIAALLDAPLTMDCTRIDVEGRRANAAQYSGKTVATISLHGRHFIYGLMANVIAPELHPVSADIIEFAEKSKAATDCQVLETRTGKSGSPYLAEADIIISGGRGLKNGENFKLLFDCAKLMGASVGASRVAVDNGWVPYAMQVGQTGLKVNPKVYIAVGISGSIQHFAGMKTSKMIIAINADKNAPIMANCDYYAVGDLFAILPELKKALTALLERGPIEE